MRTLRDERGFAELLVGVIIGGIVVTVIVAGVLVPRIVSDIREGRSAWTQGRSEKGFGGGGSAQTAVFIGPAAPSSGDAAACWARVMSSHGITWTANGWREESGHKEPKPTGDPSVDRGAMSVWESGLRGFVADAVDEAKDKCKDQVAQPTEQKPQPKVGGTYALTTRATTCNGRKLSTLSVSQTDSELKITVQTGGGAFTFTGPFTLSFAMTLTEGVTLLDSPGTVALRLYGNFDDVDTTPTIQNGQLQIDFSGEGGTACQIDFTGKRT